MKSERIRVFVADDHAIVREGYKRFLDNFDFEWLGEAVNGVEAVSGCIKTKPDIVLMDLFMPVMDGIEATHLIRQQCPQSQIIVMTSSDSCRYILEAFHAGAVNYVLKGISTIELAKIIRAAHANQFCITHETIQVLVSAFRHVNKPSYQLTARELEVLTLMCQGLTNTAVGVQLFISTSTVKNHVANILVKMAAKSRSEAIAHAVHHGLVSINFDS